MRVCGGVGRKDDGGGVRAREVAGVERLDMMANSSGLAPKRLSPPGPVTEEAGRGVLKCVLEGGVWPVSWEMTITALATPRRPCPSARDNGRPWPSARDNGRRPSSLYTLQELLERCIKCSRV